MFRERIHGEMRAHAFDFTRMRGSYTCALWIVVGEKDARRAREAVENRRLREGGREIVRASKRWKKKNLPRPVRPNEEEEAHSSGFGHALVEHKAACGINWFVCR